jgi:hypothetical protein
MVPETPPLVTTSTPAVAGNHLRLLLASLRFLRLAVCYRLTHSACFALAGNANNVRNNFSTASI